MKTNCLLKGGQGRDASDLQLDATAWLSVTAWLFCILLGCAAASLLGGAA